jgi:hypothetical protein
MNPVFQLRDILSNLPPSSAFINQNWRHVDRAKQKMILRLPSSAAERLARAESLSEKSRYVYDEENLVIQYRNSSTEIIWRPRWLRARSHYYGGIYLSRLMFGVGRLKHPFLLCPSVTLDKTLFEHDEFFHRSILLPLFIRKQGTPKYKSSSLLRFTSFISDCRLMRSEADKTDNELFSRQYLKVGSRDWHRIPIHVTPNTLLFNADELTKLPSGLHEVVSFSLREFIQSGWYRRVFSADTVHKSSMVAFELDAGQLTLKLSGAGSKASSVSDRTFKMSDVRFGMDVDPRRLNFSCGAPATNSAASGWMAGCLWRYLAPIVGNASLTLYSDWRLRIRTETPVARYEYWLIP